MDINPEMLERLMSKDFSFAEFDYDNLVGLAAGIIETKEINQKVLGRLAAELEGKYGDKVMEKFANSIFESTGYKVATSTLRSYRWVYKAVGNLDIPADFPFHAWKTLAGVENPQEWLNKAREWGWTGKQMVREIKIAHGDKPVKKTCPHCGKEI